MFPFSAYRTTCSLHIHLQGQTDPYRESYNVWSWSSKEYSLTSYYLKLPFFTKINSEHVAFSYCACSTSYSGWAYNRVKIPSCKNFEAKEGMGVYSRWAYFCEGTVRVKSQKIVLENANHLRVIRNAMNNINFTTLEQDLVPAKWAKQWNRKQIYLWKYVTLRYTGACKYRTFIGKAKCSRGANTKLLQCHQHNYLDRHIAVDWVSNVLLMINDTVKARAYKRRA